MKGISAIIATVLLLLITISLAGTAYIFTGGLISGRTSKAISMIHGACKNRSITIIISNDGTEDIEDDELRILIDNMDYSSNYSSLDPVAPHQTSSDSSDQVFDKGNHKVTVISPSNSVIADVFCSSSSGSCTPDCAGKNCGDDGCGGSCGSCSGSDTCCNFNCVDLNTDVNNCGSCGKACIGNVCFEGICWYGGAVTESCDQTCSSRGGCNSAGWSTEYNTCSLWQNTVNCGSCSSYNYTGYAFPGRYYGSWCYGAASTPTCSESYETPWAPGYGTERVCPCIN